MTKPHTTDLGTRYRYREEGRELERERIITLLQNIRDTWERTASFNYRNELNSIIALINGESQKRTENGTDLTQGENK